ncbi:MAG: isopenicillin N synthase family oxygenase [Planctomycetes bacterium]|nr:isopenicillin N synthase family oxygenase [Planctomycetota bacterium]
MERQLPLLALPAVADGARRSALSAALFAAWRDCGFVGITDHGIPEGQVRAALAAARDFFALPAEVKQRYEVAGGAGQRGYTRFGVEKAKDQRQPDLKEFWHVGREVGRDDPLAAILLPNLWPREVPHFEPALRALFDSLERLGGRLLELLEPALGLPSGWFAPRIARGNSILRPLHYPPLPAPRASEGGGAVAPRTGGGAVAPRAVESAAAVRAAAHEDINLITLLVGSDEPGLEIAARDGTWWAVTTVPGTIVVNVGDMLQRLTNGVLPSTTHRVVNPPPPWDARSRYSIPFFLHFEPDVVIEPLPSCVGPDRPPRWPAPIRAHDYLLERLREIGLRPGGGGKTAV